MIDVTQHIVNPRKFCFAMQNIKSHLSEDGVFIVTSCISEKVTRRNFYVVDRPLTAYEREFSGYKFSEPRRFRDKFIFSVRRG